MSEEVVGGSRRWGHLRLLSAAAPSEHFSLEEEQDKGRRRGEERNLAVPDIEGREEEVEVEVEEEAVKEGRW